jgi:hypothetical protein
MDNQVILQYAQVLGYPVCVSVALGWALWTIGIRLLDSHFALIEVVRTQGNQAVDELREQSRILRKWPSDPVKICKAPTVEELAAVVALQKRRAGDRPAAG